MFFRIFIIVFFYVSIAEEEKKINEIENDRIICIIRS